LKKNVSATQKKSFVYLTNNSTATRRLIIPILVKTTLSGSSIIGYSANSLVSAISYGSVTRDLNNPGPFNRPTCPESTNSFSACFLCAWAELTSDFLGLVTCNVAPICCMTAATIACGVFGNTAFIVGNNGRQIITNTEAQTFASIAITSGAFASSKFENNTYILN
jgi:hypothetical protein